ncbi:MAG: zinc ribbon domain-containing protein [Phycisphaerales bacterium]
MLYLTIEADEEYYMGVTTQLLKLYRVDQRLDGLKSRLRSAEIYLKAQDRKLAEIDEKLKSLNAQVRQLEATAHNDENETKGIDDRVAMLRERMNNAKTSKEHSATLVEINTLKADKSLIEDRAIGTLNTLDTLREQLKALEEEKAAVEKVRTVAKNDRDTREAEIKDQLTALEKEREQVVADVPASALSIYNDRMERNDIEDVMSAVVEVDRRNMEYTCEVSNTMLPVELVNRLLSKSELVQCPTSGAILYMPEDLRESMEAAAEKRRKREVSV